MYKCIVLGITLEKLNGPVYGTNVHIFILGSCNILSFTNISLSMWEELWWQSAWWIVSKFLSPKKHIRGNPQWTGIYYYCAHLHIRILQCTKLHELLINHVGEFAMTKCILNCLKNLTWWSWPRKSIGFQILLRSKYVPSLVKIHWRILILECSQGCYGRTVALLYPFATSLARG